MGRATLPRRGPTAQLLLCPHPNPPSDKYVTTVGIVPLAPAALLPAAMVTLAEVFTSYFKVTCCNTASSSTWQPAARSLGLASSISLWLMPSLQGTKTMDVGATLAM